MSRLRRFRYDERGSVISDVIVFGVVLSTIWVILQIALVIHARHLVQAAAQDAATTAARYQALDSDANTAAAGGAGFTSRDGCDRADHRRRRTGNR